MSEKPLPSIWPNVYCSILQTLREVARGHGYAIAIHGSMLRDLDLVAVPWTEEASEASVLAESIRASVDGLESRGCPERKAHGRLVWSFSIMPCHFIDLSVMPRVGDGGGEA